MGGGVGEKERAQYQLAKTMVAAKRLAGIGKSYDVLWLGVWKWKLLRLWSRRSVLSRPEMDAMPVRDVIVPTEDRNRVMARKN